MARRRRISNTLGEHSIFGDEQAAQLRTELDELRTAVSELTAGLHAQFTTIAAHAEIARQQADFARDEGRADLERTRETLLGLMETLREEAVESGHHVPGAAPGPSSESQTARIEAIEHQLDRISTNIDACNARQHQLADMVAAFLDTMLAEQRGEPLAGLRLT
jgi:hypothetical protein